MKFWKKGIDFLAMVGKKIYLNIANIISIARIICSPIVAIMIACAFYQFAAYGKIVWPWKYSVFVFKLYIACQISDLLDGLLARLLNIASRWGAYLDRIGDKILIVPTFIFMLFFYLFLAFQFKSLLAFPIAGFLSVSIYLEKMLMQYGVKGFKQKAPAIPTCAVKPKWCFNVSSRLTGCWVFSLRTPL